MCTQNRRLTSSLADWAVKSHWKPWASPPCELVGGVKAVAVGAVEVAAMAAARTGRVDRGTGGSTAVIVADCYRRAVEAETNPERWWLVSRPWMDWTAMGWQQAGVWMEVRVCWHAVVVVSWAGCG